MHRLLLAVVVLSISESVPCSVYADLTVTVGMPVALYADPSDVVVQLDAVGRCGSGLFHIQRDHANFKELTAVVLSAYATGKKLILFVENCKPLAPGGAPADRNILSHGAEAN